MKKAIFAYYMLIGKTIHFYSWLLSVCLSTFVISCRSNNSGNHSWNQLSERYQSALSKTGGNFYLFIEKCWDKQHGRKSILEALSQNLKFKKYHLYEIGSDQCRDYSYFVIAESHKNEFYKLDGVNSSKFDFVKIRFEDLLQMNKGLLKFMKGSSELHGDYLVSSVISDSIVIDLNYGAGDELKKLFLNSKTVYK